MRPFLTGFFVVLLFFPVRKGDGNGLPGGNASPAESIIPVDNSPIPVRIDIVDGLAGNDRQVKAGLLYDVSQNKVVWEKGLYASFPIASLTKMMTVLLVLEDIRDGKTCWDSEVRVSPQAALAGGSKIWLKQGQVYSVEDMMKSALIASANDACSLLAEYCNGSVQAFVDRMNERAISLGMFNTYFSNPTGLPAAKRGIDNFSSPSDLLILAREVLKYPDALRISQMDGEYIFADKLRIELKNHNRLAIDYAEIDGLKTGYTRKAGFCIVATASKEDERLIGIVLGGVSPQQRNSFVAEMFDNYYDKILCVGKLCKQEPVKKIRKKNTSPKQSPASNRSAVK